MTVGDDPLAALNAVLNEIIDFVREVKDARWRFGAAGSLHAELDSLFGDAKSWAAHLVEVDDDHDRSPLASMPTPSERRSSSLRPHISTVDDVRRELDDVLDRLDHHLAGAVALQVDADLRDALADVENGVRRHRQVLSAL